MNIFEAIIAIFRQQKNADPISKTSRIFPKKISSIESEIEQELFQKTEKECPHKKKDLRPRVHISQLEPLDYSNAKLLFAEKILAHNPSVRLFFKTGDGKDQTPIVTGRMISAQVMEVPSLPDVIDVVIRIPADQATKLPFVEVHDE